jgi:endonuclease YncB( thermonuclease family)
MVTCQHESKKDKKRIIACCFVGTLNIQEEMVRRGWAFVHPDFAGPRTAALCALDNSAAQKRVGLWGHP